MARHKKSWSIGPNVVSIGILAGTAGAAVGGPAAAGLATIGALVASLAIQHIISSHNKKSAKAQKGNNSIQV